jgi:hypothetical protein
LGAYLADEDCDVESQEMFYKMTMCQFFRARERRPLIGVLRRDATLVFNDEAEWTR